MKECSCSASAIARYQKRISGPLLDRIDIHVEVPRVDYEKLADKRNVENSETVRKRVQAARERQLQRFKGTKLTCNAEMGSSAEKLLKAAMQQLHLSARAFHRVLKLARTIADLAECDVIAANHLAEAIQYRPRVGMWCKTSGHLIEATQIGNHTSIGSSSGATRLQGDPGNFWGGGMSHPVPLPGEADGPFSEKTSCPRGAPPKMKIGVRSYFQKKPHAPAGHHQA